MTGITLPKEDVLERGMPKISIDGVEYETEKLTDNAKAQVASLQFIEVQMNKLRNEVAIFRTARQTYIASLKAELEKTKA
jgi:hypothetical protein